MAAYQGDYTALLPNSVILDKINCNYKHLILGNYGVIDSEVDLITLRFVWYCVNSFSEYIY